MLQTSQAFLWQSGALWPAAGAWLQSLEAELQTFNPSCRHCSRYSWGHGLSCQVFSLSRKSSSPFCKEHGLGCCVQNWSGRCPRNRRGHRPPSGCSLGLRCLPPLGFRCLISETGDATGTSSLRILLSPPSLSLSLCCCRRNSRQLG